MIRRPLQLLLCLALALVAAGAWAQADIDVNTPAIAALKSSMQARHGQLAPFYDSGAIGLTRDGSIAVRDNNLVPLPQRGQAAALVAQENQDRTGLYREIARANNHPEWEPDIRSTFAQRWIQKASPGWYYQSQGGGWARK